MNYKRCMEGGTMLTLSHWWNVLATMSDMFEAHYKRDPLSELNYFSLIHSETKYQLMNSYLTCFSHQYYNTVNIALSHDMEMNELNKWKPILTYGSQMMCQLFQNLLKSLFSNGVYNVMKKLLSHSGIEDDICELNRIHFDSECFSFYNKTVYATDENEVAKDFNFLPPEINLEYLKEFVRGDKSLYKQQMIHPLKSFKYILKNTKSVKYEDIQQFFFESLKVNSWQKAIETLTQNGYRGHITNSESALNSRRIRLVSPLHIEEDNWDVELMDIEVPYENMEVAEQPDIIVTTLSSNQYEIVSMLRDNLSNIARDLFSSESLRKEFKSYVNSCFLNYGSKHLKNFKKEWFLNIEPVALFVSKDVIGNARKWSIGLNVTVLRKAASHYSKDNSESFFKRINTKDVSTGRRKMSVPNCIANVKRKRKGNNSLRIEL